MPEKQPKIDYGDEIISWQVPEYEKHKRVLKTCRWVIVCVDGVTLQIRGPLLIWI